jgi:hypothetical protein
MDIRSTLANVCKKVILDRSVMDEVRLKRCEGLKLLGEFFVASGGSTEAGLGDIRQRLHQQMAGQQPHSQQSSNVKESTDQNEI